MPRLTGLWAYAHVTDVRKSIAFYAQLGLQPVNTQERGGAVVWAFLTSSPDPDRAWARLMLAQADKPIDPDAQAVLFYCWTDDVHTLHDQLRRYGNNVGRIHHPPHMPA